MFDFFAFIAFSSDLSNLKNRLRSRIQDVCVTIEVYRMTTVEKHEAPDLSALQQPIIGEEHSHRGRTVLHF